MKHSKEGTVFGRHFPAHQGSNFRKPILNNCVCAQSLRPDFASWKGTLRCECAKSSSRNSQQCLKCRGTVARGSLCKAGAVPMAAPMAAPAAIPRPSSAAGHHSLGAAARAVWGEQSQLDPWGRAGAGCCQQGDITPVLGDHPAGQEELPWVPRRAGFAAGFVVFCGAKEGSQLWQWGAPHGGHSWVQSGSGLLAGSSCHWHSTIPETACL